MSSEGVVELRGADDGVVIERRSLGQHDMTVTVRAGALPVVPGPLVFLTDLHCVIRGVIPCMFPGRGGAADAVRHSFPRDIRFDFAAVRMGFPGRAPVVGVFPRGGLSGRIDRGDDSAFLVVDS